MERRPGKEKAVNRAALDLLGSGSQNNSIRNRQFFARKIPTLKGPGSVQNFIIVDLARPQLFRRHRITRSLKGMGRGGGGGVRISLLPHIS